MPRPAKVPLHEIRRIASGLYGREVRVLCRPLGIGCGWMTSVVVDALEYGEVTLVFAVRPEREGARRALKRELETRQSNPRVAAASVIPFSR